MATAPTINITPLIEDALIELRAHTGLEAELVIEHPAEPRADAEITIKKGQDRRLVRKQELLEQWAIAYPQ